MCCLFRRKFINEPRYLGDCHSSDMSSPTRAKKVLILARRVVKRQRRKISLLQKQNRRLQSKVHSLKSLLTYLRENQYISSSAESVIEVDIHIDIYISFIYIFISYNFRRLFLEVLPM